MSTLREYIIDDFIVRVVLRTHVSFGLMKQHELLGKAWDVFYLVLVYLSVWHSDLDQISYFHLYLKSYHLHIIQKNHSLLEHLVIFSSGDLIRFLEVGI